MSHYNLEAYTPRHAVFSSRWAECIVVDRASLRSYYAQDGVTDCTSLMRALGAGTPKQARLFDSLASDYVACGGAAEPLPADVMADLGTIADLEAVAAC